MLLAAAAAAFWRPAAGQERGERAAHVAFIAPGTAAQHKTAVTALRARLRELGYVEKKNLRLELRFADSKPGRLTQLARPSADVILTSSMHAALAALEADNARPVVMEVLADPIQMTVIENVTGQGGNLTGSMAVAAELIAQRLELLREILPAARAIALLVNPENSSMAPLAREAEPVGEKLGFAMLGVGVRRVEQLPGGLEASAARGVQALLVVDDPLFAANAGEIARLAAARKIPTLGFDAAFAEAGALASYGLDQRAMVRRSADYIDRILKGARAADLRIERVSQFELVVNLKAAQALGVEVPEPVVSRATRVIK